MTIPYRKQMPDTARFNRIAVPQQITSWMFCEAAGHPVIACMTAATSRTMHFVLPLFNFWDTRRVWQSFFYRTNNQTSLNMFLQNRKSHNDRNDGEANQRRRHRLPGGCAAPAVRG